MSASVVPNPVFATTHWTVVLNARDPASPEARAALGELCRTYWYPLYAYARGRGHAVEDAQDLTQEFFSRVLQKNYIGVADRKKGRFRWFLLTAFKGFLANEFDRGRAAKRGGGQAPVSLDAAMAEQQFALEPRVETSPDKLFDRRWALRLLEQAQERLRAEYTAAGKGERYRRMEDYLPGDRTGRTYAQTGVALGMSESAVKVEVHRMKKRFADLLRDEIARTVASEREIDDELRHLMEALS